MLQNRFMYKLASRGRTATKPNEEMPRTIDHAPQAVGKIVMDTARGSLTFYWHHADEPSYPMTFAWYAGVHLSEQRAPTDTEHQRERRTPRVYSYIELVGSRPLIRIVTNFEQS
jgi:hypothetical protein